MRTSTCGGTRGCRSCSAGSAGTSRITTRSVCIRPWITGRRRRCTGRAERRGGRPGKGEAFFFAPPSLSLGEGRVGRKRMPWGRAEEQRRGRAEFSSTVVKDGTFLVLNMGSTLWAGSEHRLSTLRPVGHPARTQDSLPAVGQTLPGGLQAH